MPIYDIFSKRQKRLRGEISDVYQYDEIPEKLRKQIQNITKRFLGSYIRSWFLGKPEINNFHYREIDQILSDEWGEDYQCENSSIDDYIYEKLCSEKDTEKCIDIIEVLFKVIYYYDKYRNCKSDAIKELNTRFQEAGVGYQFENGQIMRIDSTFTHKEIVKPALHLLSADPDYEGTLKEFLDAHEKYRSKDYKNCIIHCGIALEGFIKLWFESLGGELTKRTDIEKYLNMCVEKGGLPSYIKNTLQTNMTLRNQFAHANAEEATAPLASYTLHLTASNLLFLDKCRKNIS